MLGVLSSKFAAIMKTQERIILGIDPGTVVMGYGIIKASGKKLTVVAAGILKLNSDDEHYDRLKLIFETMLTLIDSHHPDELAIEEPFFGKNVQSMLKLGRAQGVAMAAALYRQIPVFGYTPRKVKQSITGKGAASKEQVASMILRLLNIDVLPTYLDATDALGVAICHYFQSNTIEEASKESKTKKIIPTSKSKSYTGWESYLTQNPERVKKKKS